jgi:uncharacterized protein (TIGR00369 family)
MAPGPSSDKKRLDNNSKRVEQLRQLSRQFMEYVPHNRALGVQVVRVDDGEAVMSVPYADKLVGNPLTGVLHGGVVTSLMDACCGAAVFMKLEEPMRIATLDLRIDYLKPAVPGSDIVARATCYKITRNVAFVRCMASHEDPDDAIASASGTFMLIRPKAS